MAGFAGKDFLEEFSFNLTLNYGLGLREMYLGRSIPCLYILVLTLNSLNTAYSRGSLLKACSSHSGISGLAVCELGRQISYFQDYDCKGS